MMLFTSLIQTTQSFGLFPLYTEKNLLASVRQACVQSPLFFRAGPEKLFKEALEEAEDGIMLNGVLIINLRYAD